MLTSYFSAHQLRYPSHVLLFTSCFGWTLNWYSQGPVTTEVVAVSWLSVSMPTGHPPQQQETPPFDPHPEYDDPTMPTQRLPKDASWPCTTDGQPVSCHEIHTRQGPCLGVNFPSLWLQGFPPRCPRHRIFINLLDGWNYLELATPLQPPCNFLRAARSG